MTLDLRTVLTNFSPERQSTEERKIAARIDQLESILIRAPTDGIPLASMEVRLIKAIVGRLYLERVRLQEADSLTIRSADACVSRFVERLVEGGK